MSTYADVKELRTFEQLNEELRNKMDRVEKPLAYIVFLLIQYSIVWFIVIIRTYYNKEG